MFFEKKQDDDSINNWYPAQPMRKQKRKMPSGQTPTKNQTSTEQTLTIIKKTQSTKQTLTQQPLTKKCY